MKVGCLITTEERAVVNPGKALTLLYALSWKLLVRMTSRLNQEKQMVGMIIVPLVFCYIGSDLYVI